MNKKKNKDKVKFMNGKMIHFEIPDSEAIFGEQKKHQPSDVAFVSINEQEKSVISGDILSEEKQRDVTFISIDEQQKDILNKK